MRDANMPRATCLIRQSAPHSQQSASALKHPTLELGGPPRGIPLQGYLTPVQLPPTDPSSPGSAASFLPPTRQPIRPSPARLFRPQRKESARLMSSRAKECTLPHTKSCISDPPELLINVSLNLYSLLFSLEVCSLRRCRRNAAVLIGITSLPNEISTIMVNGSLVGCRPPTLKGKKGRVTCREGLVVNVPPRMISLGGHRKMP